MIYHLPSMLLVIITALVAYGVFLVRREGKLPRDLWLKLADLTTALEGLVGVLDKRADNCIDVSSKLEEMREALKHCRCPKCNGKAEEISA